ncbi:response regulator [Mucilaginibacter corticis]|uniref:Response regulator n=1 Tax=Mucilaginibacter corticis TaxID=2597670 RepID=A0A556M9N9_9SPHI|nr:response regulator [Mucilaginibacter corticis]TSJ36629.1 response regulator [Mucilaginibacter corticis]
MNKRILILDDHQAILEVVTEALRYEQYDVLDITLGSQLFDAVRDFSPDLILLDYKLSDNNGGDLCRLLKDTPEHRHIPVVIFSAYFTRGDAAMPGGCDDILYKPFDLESLVSTVSGLLEHIGTR